jgi:hypothetical protein
MGGIQGLLVPGDGQQSPESIEAYVRKAIKKAEKKREKASSDTEALELVGEIQVLSTISNVQQQLLGILSRPPVDPVGNPITALSSPPTYGINERAVLRWSANAVVDLTTNLYNVISALRGEVLLGFLANGLTGHKKKSGLFGGGIGGLLILSSVAGGGGLGLGGILGGGVGALPTNYQLIA